MSGFRPQTNALDSLIHVRALLLVCNNIPLSTLLLRRNMLSLGPKSDSLSFISVGNLKWTDIDVRLKIDAKKVIFNDNSACTQ